MKERDNKVNTKIVVKRTRELIDHSDKMKGNSNQKITKPYIYIYFMNTFMIFVA